MSNAIVFGLICGATGAAIWLGVFFGTRWINRQLRLDDANTDKPVWGPTPCEHGHKDWRHCSTCNGF